MKKVILCFIISIFSAAVQAQKFDKKEFTGSWLNVNIADFYESKNGYDCNNYSFDNEKFRPLYLSFLNKDKLIITFRIEHKKFIYKVDYSNPEAIFIRYEKNAFRISVLKEVLRLQYDGNLIMFKKVSDNFSTDVLGEYIKGMIFKDHKSYTIKFFKENNKYDSRINRKNFQQKIQELFKCDEVEFVKLGRMKSGNTCLPEIALYFNTGVRSNTPRVLGILKDRGGIRFIDSAGDNILILKPN